MKYLLLALMSLVCATSEGQQMYVQPVVILTQKVNTTTTSVYTSQKIKRRVRFTTTYSPAYVIQYNVESEVKETEYSVTGKCIYSISYNKNTTENSVVLFKQYAVDGPLTKTNEYAIVAVTEDDTAYDCLVSDGVGNMNIIFWKDHSMVILENDYTRVFVMQEKK